ncbi:LOW QUALITY PROTEIN: hypothetical protein PNEG_04263 [Pneumocystis murina B123]|uniref:Uncharacterized protein n=1 Tax=Pneumocystis murina (strain B123) TaxID=1069680 RepID=A0A0W4ZX35_PNEMU|nr:LOW QUALITY PROTEIN: hypothetical protein PNEG_04263 [Pneumocystis murina B123]KTW32926.1 LOW QUALITY PROTEIN: hypothetical protein PNEG_04263 [Pneumocystis murina B123]
MKYIFDILEFPFYKSYRKNDQENISDETKMRIKKGFDYKQILKTIYSNEEMSKIRKTLNLRMIIIVLKKLINKTKYY